MSGSREWAKKETDRSAHHVVAPHLAGASVSRKCQNDSSADGWLDEKLPEAQ